MIFIPVLTALPEPGTPVVCKINQKGIIKYHVCRFNGDIDWQGTSHVYSHVFAEGQNNVMAWFYVPIEETDIKDPEVVHQVIPSIEQEFAPGQRLTHGGSILECTVGSRGGCCVNCHFKKEPEQCKKFLCAPDERKDKTPVYFQYIRPL